MDDFWRSNAWQNISAAIQFAAGTRRQPRPEVPECTAKPDNLKESGCSGITFPRTPMRYLLLFGEPVRWFDVERDSRVILTESRSDRQTMPLLAIQARFR